MSRCCAIACSRTATWVGHRRKANAPVRDKVTKMAARRIRPLTNSLMPTGEAAIFLETLSASERCG
jgi:hypothetical protein